MRCNSFPGTQPTNGGQYQAEIIQHHGITIRELIADNIKQKLKNIMDLPHASGHTDSLVPKNNKVKMLFEYDTNI